MVPPPDREERTMRQTLVLLVVLVAPVALASDPPAVADYYVTSLEMGRLGSDAPPPQVVHPPAPLPMPTTDSRALRITRATLWSAAAADLAFTEYAVRQGYREGNPIMRDNTAVRAAVKMGSAFLLDRLSQHFAKKGDLGAAIAINLIGTGVWGFSAGWSVAVTVGN
jgi:hypothetical protein